MTDPAEPTEAEATEAGAAEHSIGILAPPALLAASAAGYDTDPAQPTESEVADAGAAEHIVSTKIYRKL